MMRFELKDVPEDLEPGDYATQVVSAKWKDNDLVVTIKFNGPLEGKHDCLFPIRRRLVKGESKYTLSDGEEVTTK